MSKHSDKKKNNSHEDKDGSLIEKMVAINRVSKVVKGGRILSFSALTVVGDGNGRIGMGKGKAKEVPVAVQKAMNEAKKNMVKIYMNNGTIYHKIVSSHGATSVLMLPAIHGTGVIAGGAVRALFEAIGITDIVVKCHGSTNPYNVIRAAIKGLRSINTPHEVAMRRGKTIEEILED